jgi:two-component system, chemotaxis family, protein-glutamate methylesterase/glutaminase
VTAPSPPSGPGKKKLRVLVVDDSAFNRRTITELLSSIPNVEVIGKAGDGEEALAMVLSLKPDLVTLDLEMPRMDGFTLLKVLMSKQPTPVIVVSGRGAKPDVFRALELGAVDFVVKPSTNASLELTSIRAELEQKVQLVSSLRALKAPDPHRTTTGLVRRVTSTDERPMPPDPMPKRLFVIASSTGGPPALVTLFSRLPSDLPAAIVVAQHMPERFTKTFAERLERLNGVRVAELEDREPLRAGRAVVCPGGRCLELSAKGTAPWVRVVMPGPEDRYVPSGDRLFESAASVFGMRTVGVILTGMGDDGTKGARAIKAAGGLVLAESEESAAIYGMPGSAVRAGVVDQSLSIPLLADHIVRLATG